MGSIPGSGRPPGGGHGYPLKNLTWSHGECSRKCLGRAGWRRTMGYLGPFVLVLESQPVFEKNRKSGPSFLLEILTLFILAFLSAHSWALPASSCLPAFSGLCHISPASQAARVVKNPPANAGDIRDAGSTPRSGRSHGGGHTNPLQCSCLDKPMDREA